jgi:hypothetical protein
LRLLPAALYLPSCSAKVCTLRARRKRSMSPLPTIVGRGVMQEKLLSRLGSVIAYFVAAILCEYAESTARSAYYLVCQQWQHIDWPVPQGADVVKDILLGTLVMSVPVLVARSNVFVTVNLVLASAVLGAAFLLSFSAATPPYECFTMGGHYEDNVSGRFEFTLYAMLVLSLSTIFSLVDLSVWGFGQLTGIVQRMRRDPTAS